MSTMMRCAIRGLAIAVAAATLCLSMADCGGKSSEAAKAESARLAEARSRLAGAQVQLAAAKEGAPERAERLGTVLSIEVMELGELNDAFALCEANATVVDADPRLRALLAVAQSMQAGREKKIEDKLAWLGKGMRSFDRLNEDYPMNETVLLYQASTYASFPPEVGAKAETLDILETMRGAYAKGAWKLEAGTAKQIAWIYSALAKNNPGADSVKEIRESRNRLAKDLPLLAAALEARS